MAAKIVSVSDDDITYYTLPGNSGELSRDGAVVDDTIFGQTFRSGLTGILSWGINANAVYKGYVGYVAKLLKQGSTTAFTTEACTLVSGKTYQIDATAKRIWDRSFALTVYDGGVDHTADVLEVDFLFGKVTFEAAYTVGGAVTISGKYFPTAALGDAQSYTLTQTAEAIDTTDFPTAQANGGYRTHTPGLRQVSLEVPTVYSSSDDWQAQLVARNELIIEINPDGASKSLARGFFRNMSTKQAGNVGALETEGLNFQLNVPIAISPLLPIVLPFSWSHAADSQIPTAIQKVLNAFLNETLLYVKYLPNGTTGFKGSGVVTNCSLSGGLDSMNAFTFNLSGSGAMSAV